MPAGVLRWSSGAPTGAALELRPLLEAVLPFDSAELEGFTEADAARLLGSDSALQVGALDLFIAEAQRRDPGWPGLKEERRQRLANWEALEDWQRGRVRQKKTWSEKGTDFFLCGTRYRTITHTEQSSSCDRRFGILEYCRLRGCPRCGDKQADDFYEKWFPRLYGVYKYHPRGARGRGARGGFGFYHITLTSRKRETRPTPDESRELWREFLSKVGRFCRLFYPGRRGSSSLLPELEGCGTVSQGEVGRNKDGTANWNQHAHVIAYGPRHDVARLKWVWSELADASGYGVQVRWIGSDPEQVSKSLHHMFKYYRKPFSHDPKTYVDTLLGMDGVRLRRATGIFYRDRRSGSDWSDRVEEWEGYARGELEALGRIRPRELRCFECDGLLQVDFHRGLLWRSTMLAFGYEDYEKARSSRGPPAFTYVGKFESGDGGADEV